MENVVVSVFDAPFCGFFHILMSKGTVKVHVVVIPRFVGQIGVYTGWVNDVASGAKAAITAMDWIGLVLICFILPALLTWAIGIGCRKLGWIKEGDLKLDL